MIPRRGLLAGLGALLAAPAIIRTPGLLMPVRPVLAPVLVGMDVGRDEGTGFWWRLVDPKTGDAGPAMGPHLSLSSPAIQAWAFDRGHALDKHIFDGNQWVHSKSLQIRNGGTGLTHIAVDLDVLKAETATF